ncbi:MAG: hypothetical protein AB7P20_18280 [Rhizobiaceae bacterium]
MQPSWDALLSLQTLVGLGGIMGSVVIGFVQRRWVRIIGLFLLGLITWYGLAVVADEKNKSERDYAIFFVHPNYAAVEDGKVMLFKKATGILDRVKVCILREEDYAQYRNARCDVFAFDEGEEAFTKWDVGNWVFDIDSKTRLGKVRQLLNIADKDGVATVISSKAIRKETGEVLCETPALPDGNPCR